MIQQEKRQTDAKLYAKLTRNLLRLSRVSALTLNLVRLFCVFVLRQFSESIVRQFCVLFRICSAPLSCVCFAFLFCVCFALLPLAVQAAEIYINSATSTSGQYGMNQQWKADIFLDTAGENINAVEGKLIFPPDLLEAKTISDGNSAISLWIEKPRIETDGRITFAGITPNGFNIRQGLIFSVTFSSKQAGSGALALSGARTLLNDGQGTASALATSGWPFLVSAAPAAPASAEPKDIYPPEEFLPKIASDPGIFDGQWFLVFATQDKGAGMAGYGVYESKQKQKKTGAIKWQPAENPYLLQDQKLSSYIYVRALDLAGNERIEVIAPRHPAGGQNILPANAAILIIIIAALVLIIAGYFIVTLWRKKTRRLTRR